MIYLGKGLICDVAESGLGSNEGYRKTAGVEVREKRRERKGEIASRPTDSLSFVSRLRHSQESGCSRREHRAGI